MTGFQPWLLRGDVSNANYVYENSKGINRAYPFGPSCVVDGYEIPCFVSCNESGTMTPETLVNIFKHIDKYYPFDRSDGVSRFVLLDGHSTRFSELVLKYFNTPATKWVACIGVPYNTKLWQLGDSEEINGSFALEVT